MGWPPAVVIVVRHGARLDAADKQWHLTSPTPYDPPLTYGGWKQSRDLGARIANILRTRETDDELLPNELTGGVGRKRRHKVIIHTSPFLRCVQTSVAISAGLAQHPGHSNRRPTSSHRARASPMHSSPRTRPTIITGSPRLAAISEPVSSLSRGRKSEHPENIKRSIIRIDAFLGEWLTPDYFELITPPPSDYGWMVMTAKTDLKNGEDYSYLANHRETASATYNTKGFPGGWGSPVVVAEKDKEKDDGGLSDLPSLSHALPRRDRTSSLSSVGSSPGRPNYRAASPLPNPAEHGIYQPPVPNYAISSSNPIPTGYVSHAKDACVDVDEQWDSMNEPHNWGTGGEYGEEWSSMHKRFRKGLQQMITWYSNSDNPGELLPQPPLRTSHIGLSHDGPSDDEDTDLVIILVTHGAGCNALIGALTNQPVLLDVGMASLTMAVRKPSITNTPASTPGETPNPRSRPTSRTLSISDQYEVKLVANTEHLRTSSSSTPVGTRGPSLPGLNGFREKFGMSSVETLTFGKSRPSNNSNLGSIRRTSTIANSTPRSFSQVRHNSIGLWAPPAPEEEAVDDAEDDMIMSFGDDTKVEPKSEENAIADTPPNEAVTPSDEDEVAPLGLWGYPRPPGQAEKIREIGPKRRWTVNERG